MIFKPSDIKWVKNVKRENGTGWAFFESGSDMVFSLTFSKDQTKGAKEVIAGEIILLFQKVDRMPGIAPKTYLTHLVTPIDNILKENPDTDHRFKWERKVIVIAKANPRTSIYTNPRNLSFFKPNRGKICSVQLLSETQSLEEIQKEIWKLFNGHFNNQVESNIEEYNNIINHEIIDEDFSVLEGKEIEEFRKHKRRERNPIIIELAKKRALVNGKILCECCSFDFKETYGDLGTKFIECHHKLPIAKGGERETRIEDLAMVCSNCHRMMHRKDYKDRYLSVEQLKEIIKNLRLKK